MLITTIPGNAALHVLQALPAQPAVLPADVLRGKPVCNEEQHELGHVDEVVLDLATGRLAYVALAPAPDSPYLFALPWTACRVQQGDDGSLLLVVAGVHQNDLTAQRGFLRGHWPTCADVSWTGLSSS